jgi:polysaccharide pyruvyl transferase WcaK-like protein
VKLGLFDPGLEDNHGTISSNLGDLIIQEAVNRELKTLFGPVEPLRISTQARMTPELRRRMRECEQLFVGGTNLLSSHMREYKQWQIGGLDAWLIRQAVLLGVGWWQYQDQPDLYTRFILRRALSKSILHSVRDSYTQKKLQSIGFKNVLNTGCPTMWPLADFDYSRVPADRSPAVLVMLTDYLPDRELDGKLLALVTSAYEKVYFWPQGRNDLEYFKSLNFPSETLAHSFTALNDFINSDLRFDYIGTRLHGGVQCLLAGRRPLVLEVDNRAKEIARDTGFPTVARDGFDAIRRWITGSTSFNIKMNSEAIAQWRGQFQTSSGQIA